MPDLRACIYTIHAKFRKFLQNLGKISGFLKILLKFHKIFKNVQQPMLHLLLTLRDELDTLLDCGFMSWFTSGLRASAR